MDRSRQLVRALAVVAAVVTMTREAATRPLPSLAEPPRRADGSTAERPKNLRGQVGLGRVTHVLGSGDVDDRRRAIERLAELSVDDAVSMLAPLADEEARGRLDPLTMLTLARALGERASDERARAALLTLVNAPTPTRTRAASSEARSALPAGTSTHDAADLARATAAIALAASRDRAAYVSLTTLAARGGAAASAARDALVAYPPEEPLLWPTRGPHSVELVEAAAATHDLRALPMLHAAAQSASAPVRARALIALAELGDSRVEGPARSALAAAAPSLRAAGATALCRIHPSACPSVARALLGNAQTLREGLSLSEECADPSLVDAVAAVATAAPDPELRERAVLALGALPGGAPVRALTSPSILGVASLAPSAWQALARSRAPEAESALRERARGADLVWVTRAYVARRLRGERPIQAIDDAVRAAATSPDARERRRGAFGAAALGLVAIDSLLDDRDATVVRSAALGALARRDRRDLQAMRARLPRGHGAAFAALLPGLLAGSDAPLTTAVLRAAALGGGAEAPVAALVWARRATDRDEAEMRALLTHADPRVRGHAAAGLGESTLRSAPGALARLYLAEVDERVRADATTALCKLERTTPSRAGSRALSLASRFDPSPLLRERARCRPLAHGEGEARPNAALWLRLTGDRGAAPYAASVRDGAAVALPFYFEEDGAALVGVRGSAPVDVVLAPHLSESDARRHEHEGGR